MVVGDGAMGTMLQRAGLPSGAAPDVWNLERPDAVMDVHQAYAAAGAAWVQTNTFGASRARLVHCGWGDEVRRINRLAVGLARAGAPGLPVLASLGPTTDPHASCWERVYSEQVEALAEAGVDGFIVETILSIEEGLAAVRAAVRAKCGPVIACFTPGADGYLPEGASPEAAAEAWGRAGAAGVGVNCGGGPEALLEPARRLAAAQLAPVWAAPNAGLPLMQDGVPTYALQPDGFARAAIQFQDIGVHFFAGCCGTGPEHIRSAVLAAASAPREN